MLLLALALGFLISLPQLLPALRYYPHSIRSGKTAEEKQALGNVPLNALWWGLVWPTRLEQEGQVDGVFYPEVVASIGLPALLLACLGSSPFWWAVCLLSLLLAMGKHTPLFRWTAPLHLRIPARYVYFVGLSLAFLSIEGFSSLSNYLNSYQLAILLALQCASLLTHASLWPMGRWVQRWDRPSRADRHPLVSYLRSSPSGRISGLPYPLRTGQLHQLHTLGYNGGSQARWMATLRGDENPNGSGGHDWFATGLDGPSLDAYGVRWAYTYRPLRGKWHPTPILHLYENVDAKEPPAWPPCPS